MAPGLGGAAKQSIQVRTACQRCRALKSRCMPSGQQGICQRCSTSKRECVWPETRQRANPPRGPSRISQVEKKLDGLVASITHNGSDQGKSHNGSPGACNFDSAVRAYTTPSRTPASQLPEEEPNHEHDDLANSIRDVTDLHNFDPESDHAKPDIQIDAGDENDESDDCLTQSLQGQPEMESLFEQYRIMMPAFPFVLIDSQMTAQTMCARKPILLLAIMTVSSWRNRKLQLSLERRYRRELASRTFTQRHKTLALLQSMLVYTAWYHYYPSSNLANSTMLQTAIGLASDLKLNPQTVPQLLPGRNPLKRVRGGTDGQRALLGCYHLSSSATTSLVTPNLFRYSSYMSECVTKLEQDSQTETDRILSYVIRARYLADHVYHFLHPHEYQTTLPSQEQVILQLRIWEMQVAQWWQEASIEDSYMLSIEYHGNRMELYYSVFRHLCRDRRDDIETASKIHKVDILSSCLEAGRSLLDILISIPIEEYPLLTYLTWVRLPRIIMTLAMFTSPSGHHEAQWNVKAARDRVRLDLFIESLCFRMQSLTTFNPPSQPQPDYWFLMKTVLQSVGKWYKRAMTRGSTMLTPASHTTRSGPYSKTNSSLGTTFDVSDEFTNVQTVNPVAETRTYQTNFPYTPTSTNANPYDFNPQIDMSSSSSASTFQPPPGTLLCPMMRLDNGPELDQFLETGFWADGHGGFDMSYFDFSA